MYQRIGNMPKACPYVMIRFLFALSDNLISEDWFFAKRLFFCFCFSPPRIYPLNTLIRGERIRGGGEGVKKAAWERGGFQAAAYLD